MAVINFLPDRLNNPPAVYKGFTTGELGLAAGTGVLLGVPLALPMLPIVGWVILPTCMLLTPLLVVFIGGHYISSYKRGKPDNYIWRRFQELRARLSLAPGSGLVLSSQPWQIKRSVRITRGR
ncbi:TIGR03750 family conjugal transfer protein [Dickeya oryzae]|uniref:TIGR03750 family conjugal transfer protein n=1 Tax=Dickeya oryzae TaxID=1240404 RepID=UPI001AECB288|nr:TIGR03750 family conjugal transfer protein [Dickeya oryzae]MBP2847558.1 TIGR03750 family conjugal transfer protein [Dickeya oryzae]